MQWLARAAPVGQDGLIGCRATERGRVLVPPASALAFGPPFAFETKRGLSLMPSSRCKQCDQPLVEIDHWGERLTGCPTCNRWQASTGEWCRLAPDDIVALRELKAVRLRAEEKS